MKRNSKNLLHLHADITAYAASKLADYGLPRCDLGDVVSEAYLKAQAKLPRYRPRKNRNALFKAIAWSEVMNELERRNRIAVLHDKHDLRLDAPKPTDADGDDSDELEGDGLAIGDGGKAAEEIRSFDEEETDELPEWRRVTKARYETTHNDPRKVLDGLKKSWDFEKVRNDLGYGRDYFYLLVKNLQIRFDQCFRAYHAWLAEKWMRSD